MNPPRILVTPDPEVWFVGPTEDRPFDVWLPQAVALLREAFEVGKDNVEIEHYLSRMLERIGRPDDSVLAYRLIRWHVLNELPFVASFGLALREDVEDDIDAFLSLGDPGTVEAPVVETLTGSGDATSIRRAVSYSQDETALLIEARYIVDTGDREVLALIQAVHRSPGEVMGVLNDLDEFARAIQISRGA